MLPYACVHIVLYLLYQRANVHLNTCTCIVTNFLNSILFYIFTLGGSIIEHGSIPAFGSYVGGTSVTNTSLFSSATGMYSSSNSSGSQSGDANRYDDFLIFISLYLL